MSMSDWAIEIQEENYRERKEDWIRRELDNTEADENTPGWERLEEEYDEIYENWDNYIQDEYEWHSSQDHSIFYVQFLRTIEDVKNILKSKLDPIVVDTIYKVIHVHIITAMETYLGNTFKSAVLSDRKYIDNAAKNLAALSKRRFTLEEILQQGGIKKIVSDQLSEYLYHNVPKVMEYYQAVLGISISYNLGVIIKNTKIRHDIAHRNGKTVDGKYVTVNNASLLDTISEIESFISVLDSELADLDAQ